jgi:hypothetical protein
MERISQNLETLRSFSKDEPAPYGVVRIVSDGQSGAARGALDAGLALGLNVGGWCSIDRVADDGPLDPKYGLRKRFGGFGERVAANIRHSDGTMMLSFAAETALDPRTLHAQKLAKLRRKALVHLQLPQKSAGITRRTADAVRAWFDRCSVRTLNVIGPFEKVEPGIAEAVQDFLELVLTPGSV